MPRRLLLLPLPLHPTLLPVPLQQLLLLCRPASRRTICHNVLPCFLPLCCYLNYLRHEQASASTHRTAPPSPTTIHPAIWHAW
jgi:hypothetical protein